MTTQRLGSTRLDGVWVREARSVDDGPFVECTDAYWLQAGPWFVDVRLPRSELSVSHPLDLAQGFSGLVCTQGSTVTWTHDLDTLARPAGYSDTAQTRLANGVLVEWADGYEEHWRSAAPDDARAVVVEQQEVATGLLQARIVRVGMLAGAVWRGREPGAALLIEAGGWQAKLVVGSAAMLDAIRDVLRSETEAAPLPSRWRHPDVILTGITP
jgi:hypothetical protein